MFALNAWLAPVTVVVHNSRALRGRDLVGRRREGQDQVVLPLMGCRTYLDPDTGCRIASASRF